MNTISYNFDYRVINGVDHFRLRYWDNDREESGEILALSFDVLCQKADELGYHLREQLWRFNTLCY